jgi:hypothetical protein
MRNIRVFAATALCFLFASSSLSAQSYNTAFGVRIERGIGFTVQQYITNGWTAEGILHASILNDDLGLTVLAEKHNKILFRGLNVYYGPGLHYYGQKSVENDVVGKGVFGLSGIVGAEISLGRINVSADIKPELHLSGDLARPYGWNGAAVSVRYIIDKRERKRLRDHDVFDRFKSKKKSKKRN